MGETGMKILKLRAGEGYERDLAGAAWEAFKRGDDITGAVSAELIDRGVERYRDKIGAMLRRGGFEVENGEVLTVEKIAAIVGEKTGLELTDLTEAGVLEAVDKWAAARLSHELGITVTSVLNVDVLKAEIEAAVTEAIASGAALALISQRLRAKAGRTMTWSRAGYDESMQRKVMMRIAQKKYRRHNKMVWVT
jgi:hypothetical protein